MTFILTEQQLEQIENDIATLFEEILTQRLDLLTDAHPYLNKRDATEYVGVTPATLDKWLKFYPELQPIEIAGVKRIKRSDLITFMEKHKKAA